MSDPVDFVHAIETSDGGLIRCPNRANHTWTWEGDGYMGNAPPNCPVCGKSNVPRWWGLHDGELSPYTKADKEAARLNEEDE